VHGFFYPCLSWILRFLIPVSRHAPLVDGSGCPRLSVGPSEDHQVWVGPIRRWVLHSSKPDIWLLGNSSDFGLFLGVHILFGFGNCGDKVISSGMKAKQLLESRIKETINETTLKH